MTLREQIDRLSASERANVLDAMWGYPRQLFEVSIPGWMDPDRIRGVDVVTRGVMFGVSAKTPHGARLKVLEYFESCTVDNFKAIVGVQL